MTKPTRTAQHLRAMVQIRMNALPEAQRRIAVDPSQAPQVGEVIPHERDGAGRAWTILHLHQGAGLDRDFRSIVDALRDSFDLD